MSLILAFAALWPRVVAQEVQEQPPRMTPPSAERLARLDPADAQTYADLADEILDEFERKRQGGLESSKVGPLLVFARDLVRAAVHLDRARFLTWGAAKLGEVEAVLDNRDAAVVYLRLILDVDPLDEAAAQNLARLRRRQEERRQADLMTLAAGLRAYLAGEPEEAADAFVAVGEDVRRFAESQLGGPLLDLVPRGARARATARRPAADADACTKCRGSGDAPCSTCSGRRRVKCGVCDGRRKVESEQEWAATRTSVSMGMGGEVGNPVRTETVLRTRTVRVRCDNCAGRGRVPCEACRGTGKEPCDRCLGSGLRVVPPGYTAPGGPAGADPLAVPVADALPVLKILELIHHLQRGDLEFYADAAGTGDPWGRSRIDPFPADPDVLGRIREFVSQGSAGGPEPAAAEELGSRYQIVAFGEDRGFPFAAIWDAQAGQHVRVGAGDSLGEARVLVIDPFNSTVTVELRGSRVALHQ